MVGGVSGFIDQFTIAQAAVRCLVVGASVQGLERLISRWQKPSFPICKLSIDGAFKNGKGGLVVWNWDGDIVATAGRLLWFLRVGEQAKSKAFMLGLELRGKIRL